MKTKILVIGSKGQLGRDIQSAAAAFPHLAILCADVDDLDITQAEATLAFLKLHRPTFIINCAAYTAVDKAEDELEKAYTINATAVGYLAKAAAAIDAYLLQISTDYVFDGTGSKPYLEEDAVNPLSVYGKTKLAGEQAALSYAHSMVVRTAWLYTAEGNNFVNTMLRLGSERSDINVISDQFGSPTYAFDLAVGLLQIIDKIASGSIVFRGGVYHFTNEGTCSWFDFAQKIMELGHRDCQVHPISTADYPTKAHRPAYSVLSKEKIKTTYGISIPTWKDALLRCFNQK